MRTLMTLAVLALAGAIAGGIAIYLGVYNVAATEDHFRVTRLVLDAAMRQSIRSRSDDIAVPALDEPAMVERGLHIYRMHCVQCHGAPGVAPEPFALGLTPAPANLAYTAREWPPAELYWVIKHGVRMTGMPPWEFRLTDAELWAVTAFLLKLPTLSPREYQVLISQASTQSLPAAPDVMQPVAADPKRGKAAMGQYACSTCHEIPGVAGANAPVGPPLTEMASRQFIAGVLPNTPQNMIRWLRAPQKIDPLTAMPNLGVTERDARDMTAYLYTLK